MSPTSSARLGAWRSSLIGLPLIIVAAGVIVGCTARNSGIEGRVTAGPVCPVQQQGIPCPDQPYPASLSILAQATRWPVARVSADVDGHYRVLLAPGRYIVRPESTGVFPSAAEQTIEVHPGQFTRLDIVFDTGIR